MPHTRPTCTARKISDNDPVKVTTVACSKYMYGVFDLTDWFTKPKKKTEKQILIHILLCTNAGFNVC